MKILHDNMLCRKHTVDKPNTTGLILSNHKETFYEVVQAGPKVIGINVGDRLKPFKYSTPIAEVSENNEKLYIFSQGHIQDIVEAE